MFEGFVTTPLAAGSRSRAAFPAAGAGAGLLPPPPPPPLPASRCRPLIAPRAVHEQKMAEPGPLLQGDKSASPAPVPLTAGDIVVGQVVWATAKGAKIQLLEHPGVIAYMPVREGPFAIREVHDGNLWANGAVQGPCLPKGLIREFQIISVSQGGGVKQGPLLSARMLDLDRLWCRAQQLLAISAQARENFVVTVESANSGGLVSRLTGLSLFIPVSQLQKKGQSEWWTEASMREEFVGRDVRVAVMEVARTTRKVVCSMLRAEENDALRCLEVGSLVSGTVRRVEPFGVFVGLDGTRTSGLLHISNVSRQHIDQAAFVDSVFSTGDRVRCLVMGLDPDYSNISLSTAELEPADGDMLSDKQRVWDAAEDEARAFQQHLLDLKATGFDFASFAQDAADSLAST